MTAPRHTPTSSIAAEVLLATALLFGAALAVAVLASLVVLPTLASPGAAAFFVGLLVLAELAILFAFLRYVLARNLFRPLETIGEHAQRIALGDFAHRIPPTGRVELDRVVSSVNSMAARLIREQHLLEENVRSLDRTNRELVETTDELVRTARMASVGTLAGGIAHEVGNPLGALRAALDVARRRSRTGGELDEPLTAAVEEAGRIDAIVRSILEFVRVGSEERTWTRLRVDDEVRTAVALLERRGALEGIRLEVDSGAGALPPVLSRPQLLEQVVVNLTMNAVQATRPDLAGAGPDVAIALRSVTPDDAFLPPRREGDPPGVDYAHRRRLQLLRDGAGAPSADALGRVADVVIEIRDRGAGIPEADLDRVFDPFFSTRAPGEGTGMGLAITARIVEELGGEIEAANHPEGGAVFRVRLPGLKEGSPAERPPTSRQPAGPRLEEAGLGRG